MADDAGARYFKGIQQRQHIGGVVGRAEQPGRLVAVAEAAQIGGNDAITLGQPRHDRLPSQPEFRPAMKQEKRSPFPRFDQVKGGAVRAQRLMLHLPPLLPGTMSP